MVVKIPGVDADKGLDLCDGNMDFYMDALRLYITNTSTVLEKVRTVSAETLKDYVINVHGIKSISELVGAEEARVTAKELEAIAKGGDLAGVLAKNDAFIKMVETLLENIRSWLAKNDTAGS